LPFIRTHCWLRCRAQLLSGSSRRGADTFAPMAKWH
jgi:hypothetical protein